MYPVPPVSIRSEPRTNGGQTTEAGVRLRLLDLHTGTEGAGHPPHAPRRDARACAAGLARHHAASSSAGAPQRPPRRRTGGRDARAQRRRAVLRTPRDAAREAGNEHMRRARAPDHGRPGAALTSQAHIGRGDIRTIHDTNAGERMNTDTMDTWALRNAHRLIEIGWCQHADARDARGRRCAADDPAAVRWSAPGAVECASLRVAQAAVGCPREPGTEEADVAHEAAEELARAVRGAALERLLAAVCEGQPAPPDERRPCAPSRRGTTPSRATGRRWPGTAQSAHRGPAAAGPPRGHRRAAPPGSILLPPTGRTYSEPHAESRELPRTEAHPPSPPSPATGSTRIRSGATRPRSSPVTPDGRLRRTHFYDVPRPDETESFEV